MNELKTLLLGPPPLTLAAAESLTGGRVQTRITAISGASRFFLGGLTAYTIDQKVRHLSVDRAMAAAVDCVSAEVAAQMARGACALFGSDVAVATTGYAEAAPGGAAPFAWWAVALRRPPGEGYDVRTERVEGPWLGRTAMQEKVAEAALAALVEELKRRRG